MVDRHRLAWSIGFAALGAALGLVYCLWLYGWIHGHTNWWGAPTDSYMLTHSGSLLLHGHLGSVYSWDKGLYALPLSFPLAGVAALIVGWAHLPSGPHQEWIFVVVPWFCALAAPAFYQARALAWDLGVRRHLWAVQLLAAALVVPPLVEWGHVEDVLALAFTLSAVRWLVKDDPIRACLHLSVAVSFKQWAVMLVPFAVLALPPGRRLRGLMACAALPAVLASVFLAVDFHPAFKALTDPADQISGYPGHPSLLGAWLGPRSSQLTRVAETLLAAGIGYRRRHTAGSPFGVVTTAATILMVRPVFETITYPYYWSPGLLLVVVAIAALRGELRVLDWVWPILALAWTLPRSNDLTAVAWWLGEGLLLAVAAYRLRQAGRSRAGPDLLDGLVARSQPVEVAG